MKNNLAKQAKVSVEEQPFAKISTPELQARALLVVEKAFRNDLKELEDIFKSTELTDTQKEDKARQFWCDIVSAMAVCEPQQVIALVEKLGVEITADGSIEDPKKTIVEILNGIRTINTPKNMAEKIFYIQP